MAHAKPPRVAEADAEARARRLGDLIAAPILPIADVALFLDLPVSTLDRMRADGTGPKFFLLGRRLYATKPDLLTWIDQVSKTGA